jgi:ABC-type transport system involved in multi-copper enzyme maturation permease subunit
MTSPDAIAVFRWLIRDTFRHARSTGFLWLLVGVSGVCILFCLGISVRGGTTRFAPGETREHLPSTDPAAQDQKMLDRHGVDASKGELHLLFGLIRVPFQHYREEQIHFVELVLAGGVADAGGILLILIWTAGFLPTFFDGRSMSVQLAKPAPRWLLLLGKYLGLVVFVFVQAVLFVGGTWMALGLKTGVWDLPYLLAIPLLVLQFAIFFSFSLLLAVWLRSTMACALGSLVFWFLCWGGNYGRNLVALGSGEGATGPVRWTMEGLYWILPKPADLSMLVFDALHSEGYVGRVLNAPALVRAGVLFPGWSVATSLLFGVVMLTLSIRTFARAEY